MESKKHDERYDCDADHMGAIVLSSCCFNGLAGFCSKYAQLLTVLNQNSLMGQTVPGSTEKRFLSHWEGFCLDGALQSTALNHVLRKGRSACVL